MHGRKAIGVLDYFLTEQTGRPIPKKKKKRLSGIRKGENMQPVPGLLSPYALTPPWALGKYCPPTPQPKVSQVLLGTSRI